MDCLLRYCRAGFEAECSEEIAAATAVLAVSGMPRTLPGFVACRFDAPLDSAAAAALGDLRRTTDEGKALAPFCKSFGNALIGGLKKARLLDPTATRRLHAFFPQSDNVYLASADPGSSAPWPQGIPRLKFPREAPSRSTLKLEEALLTLLDGGERERWLQPGMSADDLGAAPGGWTWQLVRRARDLEGV